MLIGSMIAWNVLSSVCAKKATVNTMMSAIFLPFAISCGAMGVKAIKHDDINGLKVVIIQIKSFKTL